MYKRTYLSPEEKIQAVEEYLGGIGSLNQTAKKWEVHRSTFQKWLLNYEMFGGEGLYPRRENQYYSETLKRQAVELYLSGRASEGEVCKKYRIRSRTQLEQWISWYHGQKGFHPAGGTRRGTQMTRNYETDKAKLVEETVWQRMVAGNLGFDAERRRAAAGGPEGPPEFAGEIWQGVEGTEGPVLHPFIIDYCDSGFDNLNMIT